MPKTIAAPILAARRQRDLWYSRIEQAPGLSPEWLRAMVNAATWHAIAYPDQAPRLARILAPLMAYAEPDLQRRAAGLAVRPLAEVATP